LTVLVHGHRLEALPVVRAAGMRQAECHAEGNVGSVYLEQGRWAEAMSHLESGLRLATEIGDPLAEARGRLSLGDVHRALGADGPARAEWLAAHTIFVNLDHPRGRAGPGSPAPAAGRDGVRRDGGKPLGKRIPVEVFTSAGFRQEH
jgi:hypothetical protein